MRKSQSRIASYRDLDVWQLAMDIVIEIYRVTRAFPPEEKFGLIAQLRRAAVAIPSNIAEGHSRLGAGEFRRFVSIARGSGAEVETERGELECAAGWLQPIATATEEDQYDCCNRCMCSHSLPAPGRSGEASRRPRSSVCPPLPCPSPRCAGRGRRIHSPTEA